MRADATQNRYHVMGAAVRAFLTAALLIVPSGCGEPGTPPKPARSTLPVGEVGPSVEPLVVALRRSGATVEVAVERQGDRAEGRVITPNGERREICLETTTKGNGGLSIGNLVIRMLDNHDDGFVYEPECLEIRFVDLDADEVEELVVEGNAVQTELPHRVLTVRGVFTFDVARGRFEIVSLAGPVDFAWLREEP